MEASVRLCEGCKHWKRAEPYAWGNASVRRRGGVGIMGL